MRQDLAKIAATLREYLPEPALHAMLDKLLSAALREDGAPPPSGRLEQMHPEAARVLYDNLPELSVAPSPKAATRSCNRHDDCTAADERAKAAGKDATHCYDDCCEDCFGC